MTAQRSTADSARFLRDLGERLTTGALPTTGAAVADICEHLDAIASLLDDPERMLGESYRQAADRRTRRGAIKLANAMLSDDAKALGRIRMAAFAMWLVQRPTLLSDVTDARARAVRLVQEFNAGEDV
jgi:hypothetical protein